MIGMFRNLSPNGRVIAMTTSTVITFGALGWAAVPLYDLFCRVTGYGGTTGQAEAAPDEILEETRLVRFDASRERDFPWEFKPVQRQMRVNIGATNIAFYEAHNPTDRPIAGTASYNVAPFATGAHFVKIDCFCFEEQILMPGETVSMPVTFFIEASILDDAEAKHMPEITLSYTFHAMDLPEDYAALETRAPQTTN